MKWSVLQSILYGLITGFAEFTPVSADAHALLFLQLTGGIESFYIFRFAGHLGVFAALLISCRQNLFRLRREYKISRTPVKRRRRQPDMTARMDIRVFKTMLIPCVFSFVFYLFAQGLGNSLWLLGIILFVNGCIMCLTQFFPSGNKSSQTMSALDGVLIGAGGALSIFPGVSRMGMISTVAEIRGTDRQYAVNMGLLLSIPVLAIILAFDIYYIFAFSAAFLIAQFFHYLLTIIAGFTGAYLGIVFIRFLAVKTGFNGAVYYSWGLALFSIILYLMI